MIEETQQENYALPEGFGDGSNTGSSVQFIKLPKADGELTVRVIPPPGNGPVGLFGGEHYGWNGYNEKNPSKPIFRKFGCIEERNKDRMITQECPACTYRGTYETLKEKLKADLDKKSPDAIRAAARAKGLTEAQIEAGIAKMAEPLNQANAWLKDHNCDKKIKLWVLNDKEQYCVLSLPYGTYKKLLAAKDELIAEKKYPGTEIPVSPFGRKGVWFVIKRKGKASRDSDSVKVKEVQVQGGYTSIAFHTISDEQLTQAVKILPDLKKLKADGMISYEKMVQLVELDKAGGGKADVYQVDAILGGKKAVAAPAAALDDVDLSAFETDVPEPVKEPVKVVTTEKVSEKVKAAVKEPVKEPVKAVAAPGAPVAPVAQTVETPATEADIEALFGA